MVREAFPLPRIDKALKAIHSSNWFSSLDQPQGEMKEEQQKDLILKLVYKQVTAGEKLKTSAIDKVKFKAVRKYCLQLNQLTLKKGLLHCLYINNDVEYHKLILPVKYQAQVLCLLHDGQGHQGLECTIDLCWERFYWNTMFQDVTNYVKNCPHCQTVKGDYVDPKTKLGSIIAHGPMDLLCIDFTKVDPTKNSQENILVLTDAFTKFSQPFVTPNQKVLTIAKILVDKWFYVYGIPIGFHSDQGWCFDNQIMKHLYVITVYKDLPPCHTIHMAVHIMNDLTIQ